MPTPRRRSSPSRRRCRTMSAPWYTPSVASTASPARAKAYVSPALPCFRSPPLAQGGLQARYPVRDHRSHAQVGPERHIVVYKPVKPTEDMSEQAAYPLSLSSTTMAAIQRHFQQYPASQAELELAATGAAEPSSMFAGGDDGGGNEVRLLLCCQKWTCWPCPQHT
jgi:hypothetical protein